MGTISDEQRASDVDFCPQGCAALVCVARVIPVVLRFRTRNLLFFQYDRQLDRCG